MFLTLILHQDPTSESSKTHTKKEKRKWNPAHDKDFITTSTSTVFKKPITAFNYYAFLLLLYWLDQLLYFELEKAFYFISSFAFFLSLGLGHCIITGYFHVLGSVYSVHTITIYHHPSIFIQISQYDVKKNKILYTTCINMLWKKISFSLRCI